MAELRSFIFIDQLQPQTLSYLGSWIRGSLPRANMAAQIIEVAPGLDIEALTDIAVKHTNVKAGILVVERQFGYLEFHSHDTSSVKASAAAILDALGATAAEATQPRILGSKVITNIDHQHAFLINRNKLGSMIIPGETLYTLEMQPASYAILAANAAEKAANIKVVDYRMIGANGRVYLAGSESEIPSAREAAELALRDLGADLEDAA
jgi:ethanolamine utilization microcompartment shell protein EutL